MNESLKYLRGILNLKIERELQIEAAREQLFSILNLDLKELFNLIDKNGENLVKSSDILSFLR